MASGREVNFVGRPIDSQDPRVDPVAFRCLTDRYHVILEDAQKRGHHVEKDPMLTLDPEGLVCRYLIAEDNDAAKAEARLRATIDWRQRWNILEYHRPGEAQRLFTESSNPGAEMYFADSLHADRTWEIIENENGYEEAVQEQRQETVPALVIPSATDCEQQQCCRYWLNYHSQQQHRLSWQPYYSQQQSW
ncbi:unnamed protein product [Prorocentrum cordatum]|uniref:CRAL/TRIO N-terminal domain-containing protein n=1 Tax=Prorocentrum cordatum TaxID=2364126 RepID=A0ABN9XW53_9DINO|nr:unnamed protein product [Polarella glacialis]